MYGTVSLSWIAVMGALAAAGPVYGANDMPVGLIVSLSGSLSLQKPVPGNPQKYGEVIPLTERDVSRLLYPGDRITCHGSGHAKVRLDSVIFRNKQDLSCNEGQLIDIPPAPGSYISGTPYPLGKLQGYLIAGRSKGTELAIFSPADNSAVAIERFVLGWTTRPDIGTFVIVLLDPQGHELARSGKVNGTDGSADSGPFRRAIADYLAKSPATGNFKLVFRLDEGGEQTSTFAVLTKAQESQVNGELAGVDPDGGLFAHLERAAILDDHQLYNDTAAEYDMAIKDAPGSITLMLAAAAIDTRIGDLRRAQEYSVRVRQAEAQ